MGQGAVVMVVAGTFDQVMCSHGVSAGILKTSAIT